VFYLSLITVFQLAHLFHSSLDFHRETKYVINPLTRIAPMFTSRLFMCHLCSESTTALVHVYLNCVVTFSKFSSNNSVLIDRATVTCY